LDIVQKFLFGVVIVLLALLAGAARCWNVRDVFHDNQIYFTEADAYSRMTRVRMIAEGRGLVIRHHEFENWPAGTTPHTTAPMDWTILAVRPLLGAWLGMADPNHTSLLRVELLDFAGALVGPLLGILTCIAIAVAFPKESTRERWFVAAAVLLFAVSSILVHGTLLGRPDHQALLILLLGFALSIEVRLLRSATRPWAIVAGIAWGIALWTSLYEPLVLLVMTIIGIALAGPSTLREVNRLWEWGITAAVFGVGLLVDGWRVHLPDAAMREAFGRWTASIGEMQPLGLKFGVLWGWVGWVLIAAPVVLLWQWKRRAECRLAFAWLAATVALTMWQVRWGYFLALVFVVTLPLVLNLLPRAWMGWVAYAVGIWPLLGDWDQRLYPDETTERGRFVARHEQKALREIADIQRNRNVGPFVAPWWLSPPLAYWSRQSAVAGSSHESLPGIIDVARIYLAPDDEAALTILRHRKVAWILSDAPERVIPNSAALLGTPPPETCLANKLAQYVPDPQSPPSVYWTPGLRQIRNDFFQAWRVPAESESSATKP
jgi:hypothetical protein